MPTQRLLDELELVAAANREKYGPKPEPTWEACAQASMVLLVEAEERLEKLLGADDPLCARMRQAIYRTRHMRHVTERAARTEDAAAIGELSERATSSEVLSYGVRCSACGNWETACTCEDA